ncbi:hypothetical protein FD755_024810, partial [Muntiacus reevesi]
IPWAEEPGRLQSMGSRRVGLDSSDGAGPSLCPHPDGGPVALQCCQDLCFGFCLLNTWPLGPSFPNQGWKLPMITAHPWGAGAPASQLLLSKGRGGGSRPKMVMEYWTGWFDSWGGPHYILDSSEVLNTVSAIVEAGSSINLYMFHGGTNFGFIGGAVHFQDYKPDVTSYDYDAVLTEAGDYTAKYTRLREFFGSMSGAPLPVPPALPPKTAYDPVTPAFYVSLWDALSLLELPVTSEHPVNMENLPVNGGSGQSFGYTLYETTITSSGVLSAVVRDRGQVFLNTFLLGILDYKTTTIIIPMVQGFTTLRILVENCGRVNYGDSIDQQRKVPWRLSPGVPGGVSPGGFLNLLSLPYLSNPGGGDVVRLGHPGPSTTLPCPDPRGLPEGLAAKAQR